MINQTGLNTEYLFAHITEGSGLSQDSNFFLLFLTPFSDQVISIRLPIASEPAFFFQLLIKNKEQMSSSWHS